MLRPELLRFPLPDGGLELFDPVLDRLYALDAAETARLAADGTLPDRLRDAMLEEGPVAELVRAHWWTRKRASVPPPAEPSPPAEGPWALAEALPAEVIGPAWRDGETWRRLAEDRAAGTVALPMPRLLGTPFAAALAHAHASLAFERMAVGLTWAERHVCTPADVGPVADWLAVKAGPHFRALCGAVLGLPLPATVTANAWKLEPGDEIRAHPVGTTYVATLSLGLCRDWAACDRGAIVFADAAPGEAAFAVVSRWLPHLGDALAIARGPASWHWVESPRRTRRTLTGWWVAGA